LVELFQKYPFAASEVRYLQDEWPIDWQDDSPSLIARKLLRHALTWRPALSAMKLAWHTLKRAPLPLPVLETLYWHIVGSYQTLGLRDGIERYGTIERDSERIRHAQSARVD
jgi:hypothetical protein